MNKPIAFSSSSLIFFFALLLTPFNADADSKILPDSAFSPADPATESLHPNLSLLNKLDLKNLDASASIIAENFTWHYFNPKLPELDGKYYGVEGFKEFFKKLAETSKGSFQINIIDARPIGDELVFTQTRNRLMFESDIIEFDVVVVWRIVNEKISEGWDIPSVYNVRAVQENIVE